jgi:MFS family permease
VFAVGALGALVMGLTISVNGPTAFAALFAVGSGLVGATGFYHISQTAAARAMPGSEVRGMTRVTLYAAFSSTVFYPLGGWAVEASGWRLAMAIGAATSFLSFGWASLVANQPGSPTLQPRRWRAEWSEFSPAAWRLVAGATLSNAVIQIVSVYQVPFMTAAGLTLGTASVLAGTRGVMQFLGRVPIPRLTARFGAARTMRGAFALLTVGTAMFAAAGTVPLALIAVVVTGVAIGAHSILVGVRGREVFEVERLGSSLGTVTLAGFAAGAVAPAIAALAVDLTGTRVAAILVGTVLGAASVMAIGRSPSGVTPDRPPRDRR